VYNLQFYNKIKLRTFFINIFTRILFYVELNLLNFMYKSTYKVFSAGLFMYLEFIEAVKKKFKR